ncbi:MAG: hypothetical protein HAW61_00025, partial [Candidatus Portiera sp.]|nr:hypothetical protein [Portiera sp.]
RVGGFDVWQTSLKNPEFHSFVNSCGGLGIKVEKVKDLKPALAKALKHKGFSLVEVMTDAELI